MIPTLCPVRSPLQAGLGINARKSGKPAQTSFQRTMVGVSVQVQSPFLTMSDFLFWKVAAHGKPAHDPEPEWTRTAR
jgi:hypothetical protein